MWELYHKEGWAPKNWCLWTVVLEKILESPLNCKEIKPVSPKGNQPIDDYSLERLMLKFQYFGHQYEEPTHWKRPWLWERLKAGGEGDDRGWDGWMASLTQWTRLWASSGRWWRTGKPGVLQSMGSQRVGHNWAIEEQQDLYNFHTTVGYEFYSSSHWISFIVVLTLFLLFQKDSLLFRKNKFSQYRILINFL